MKRNGLIFFAVVSLTCISVAFKQPDAGENYGLRYQSGLENFRSSLSDLQAAIERNSLKSTIEIERIKQLIRKSRIQLKEIDFWLRYLEPVSYKRINGPLPIEWETEVFEKSEAPYKREGGGLTLAGLYLEEENPQKDSLARMITSCMRALKVYSNDSITENLLTPDHFYLCNRLFLLNLAAIYTTGFECPDTSSIIGELKVLLGANYKTYLAFNRSFPKESLPESYLNLYLQAISFVNGAPDSYLHFDHFSFLRNYVNPLFSLNQQLIKQYNIVSKSYVDYSLNKNAGSIFSKDLYKGQNAKGIFLRVNDKEALAEIEKIGKLLFYDPILSGNNLRSCASCHKPDQFFADTGQATSLQFDRTKFLPRNSPSLINAEFNHLLMLDGKHISLQGQTKDVMTNALEMGGDAGEILKKVMSCNDYKAAFRKLAKLTPQEPEITIEHISSAVTFYYSKFSRYYSPFDRAMNQSAELPDNAREGFNVFMGKAQCGTCHFVPQFNGVKPPYVGSEFEVLGVPSDASFQSLSADKGRYGINPAKETANAFRTGSLRNAERTKPYMHNGCFKTLEQVVDFYDAGGGAGRGLQVDNQTLSADSLHLSRQEKKNLLAFIRSLNEEIPAEAVPEKLPESKIKSLNKRRAGGEY